MLAHAGFVWLYSVLDRPRRGLWNNGFRIGVSSAILVWFAYYANRPHPEYLYSFAGMYGCLWIDVARVVVAGSRRAVPRLAVAGALVIGGVFALPTTLKACLDHFRFDRSWHEMTATAHTSMKSVCGLALPADERTDYLIRKAEYLRLRTATNRQVFFTVDSYLIPKAAQVWPDLSVADPFWECLTENRFAAVMAELRRKAPSEILFDEEVSIKLPNEPPRTERKHRQFLVQLRVELANDYQRIGSEAGWEIWHRRITE